MKMFDFCVKYSQKHGITRSVAVGNSIYQAAAESLRSATIKRLDDDAV